MYSRGCRCQNHQQRLFTTYHTTCLPCKVVVVVARIISNDSSRLVTTCLPCTVVVVDANRYSRTRTRGRNTVYFSCEQQAVNKGAILKHGIVRSYFLIEQRKAQIKRNAHHVQIQTMGISGSYLYCRIPFQERFSIAHSESFLIYGTRSFPKTDNAYSTLGGTSS